MRIYPDEVHVDTHEPELTADEVAWGHAFWEQTWRAGTGEAAAAVRRGVWERLVQRFGATRAAWIAEVLTPTNPGDRPAAPVADDDALARPPAFPRPATRADAVDPSAAGAAAARALGRHRPPRRRPRRPHRRRSGPARPGRRARPRRPARRPRSATTC